MIRTTTSAKRAVGIAAVIAAAWRRAFQLTDTSLVRVEPDAETLAAWDTVDELAPSVPSMRELSAQRPAAATRISPVAIFIVAGLVAGGVIAGMRSGTDDDTCTFADGTVVPGQCIFADEFSGSSLDDTVWLAADDWSGPLQNVTPDISCFRHENVTVGSGVLKLRMSINARGSCAQTWSTTAYYVSNYEPSWTPGATSYDVAVINTKTFRFKYGHVQMRIKLPPGRGPGGDVSLWGVGCQRSGGVVGALSDLFTFADGQRACDWPNIGNAEMDIIQSSRSGSTTTINTSIYTASSPGSPTLIDNFFGINYYGARYAQPATAGFSTWLSGVTVANPTTTFHLYDLDWNPRSWNVYVDGVLVASETPSGTTWIPSGSMFPMIWNAATVAVTDADLPSDMEVDYFRVWCPPGYGCTWSN